MDLSDLAYLCWIILVAVLVLILVGQIGVWVASIMNPLAFALAAVQ